MIERRKRKADKKTNQGFATVRVANHTETVLPVPPGPPCKQIYQKYTAIHDESN